MLIQSHVEIGADIRSVDRNRKAVPSWYRLTLRFGPVIFVRLRDQLIEVSTDGEPAMTDRRVRHSRVRYREELSEQLRCSPIGDLAAPLGEWKGKLRRISLETP